MKLAIVGSRDYPDLKQVRDYVNSLPQGTTIITGGAKGVDQTAEHAARRRQMDVVVIYPEWYDANGNYNKAAGMIRNGLIVATCDELVAFQYAKSKGTQNSINRARKAGKKVTIFSIDDNNEWETNQL